MPSLLEAADVADRLKVPEGWVYESARSGDLPSLKLGRYVRFEADEIDRYLAKKAGREGG